MVTHARKVLILCDSGDIELNEVFVPDANRLARAEDFERGLNNTLMRSRLTISWAIVGGIAGAFEAAYQYSMERK